MNLFTSYMNCVKKPLFLWEQHLATGRRSVFAAVRRANSFHSGLELDETSEIHIEMRQVQVESGILQEAIPKLVVGTPKMKVEPQNIHVKHSTRDYIDPVHFP